MRETFRATDEGSEMADLIYRRRLPPWQTDDATYFVTWRLIDGQPELAPAERDTILGALKFFDRQRYRLFGYVVMNDHVHVLFSILNGHSLAKIIHSWKSFTAHQLQRARTRHGAIWQPEYFDRIMRDGRELRETAWYIAGNPLTRWPELIKYPWVWVADEL